ncbi:lipoprotein-releasing ABC transporter permease subunit [Dongia soli]|uniref:Lipoprotein-releasing ABC transporter permease subunit n=1 Tax=Dongia soli TaxID=600628 RepID=A0ABU5EBT1_9PROT|nr:lipoprotein-releasing ABC transporter permease subunit [Dongia soli]MDY0883025.1 lipoprotein-releasing ABC transporter permease subunit [Dongia soli]
MIFNAFERLVAMRYLRARREEGFISVIAGFSLLGIALGVATLIVVMSVMNGFRAELMKRILGINGHVAVTSIQGPIPNYDDLVAKLRQVKGVVSATPIVEGQVFVTAANGGSGAIVRGMRVDDLKQRKLLADNIRMGSIDALNEEDTVMIGARMAEQMGLTIGSEVTLISPQTTVTIGGTFPRMKTYTIGAIFDIGMYQYDSGYVFVPLDAAQLYFKVPKAATSIEVMATSPDNIAPVLDGLDKALGPGFRLTDWQQAHAEFFNAVEVERNVMFLILTLIIVVAAFNIISGQIMMVKDKGRNIAIMRTMGASRGTILRIFLLSGASIGIVGTAAGCLLGVAFAYNIETIRRFLEGITGTNLFDQTIYFLSKLPAIVDKWEVALIVCMSLVLTLLASIYPAWRAARLDPVEALRYE